VAERVTARCPRRRQQPGAGGFRGADREILDDCIAWALQFPQENRIGFIGRARLKSALRWELREIGYEEKFAELAAEKLIARMARD